MSVETLTGTERMTLIRLAFEGGGAWSSEIKPILTKAARERLKGLGLLDFENKPKDEAKSKRKSLYLTLSDRAWSDITGQLNDPFPSRVSAGETLALVLSVIGRRLAADGTSLGEFVAFGAKPAGATAVVKSDPPEVVETGSTNGGTVSPPPPPPVNGDLPARIAEVYRELSGGEVNSRVYLSDLREKLADVSRETLDQSLLRLDKAGELALYPLDNPAEIRERDREAVLHTPGGNERHILYMGGPSA